MWFHKLLLWWWWCCCCFWTKSGIHKLDTQELCQNMWSENLGTCSLLSFSTQVSPDRTLYNDQIAFAEVDKSQEDIQNATLNIHRMFHSLHIWPLKYWVLISLFQMGLPPKLINLSNLGHKLNAVILPIISQFKSFIHKVLHEDILKGSYVSTINDM